jgi:hypothetical protein
MSFRSSSHCYIKGGAGAVNVKGREGSITLPLSRHSLTLAGGDRCKRWMSLGYWEN